MSGRLRPTSHMHKYFAFTKNAYVSAGEYLRLFWYTRPQWYESVYQVVLRNPYAQVASFTLIVPLPVQYAMQHVFDITLLPRNARVGVDMTYGNHYAYWRASLPPKEFSTFQLSFKIKKLPHFFLWWHHRYEIQDYEGMAASHPSFDSNSFMQPKHPRIQHIIRTLPKYASVSKQLFTLERYLVEYFTYGTSIKGLYTLDEAFASKTIDCGGFNVIFISLCLALGIPARLVVGFWAGYPASSFDESMHAWVEVLLPNGQIVSVDPSVTYLRKHYRSWKLGRLGYIGSDRIAFSFGCDIALRIDNEIVRVPLLQHPFLVQKKKSLRLTVQTQWHAKRIQQKYV